MGRGGEEEDKMHIWRRGAKEGAEVDVWDKIVVCVLRKEFWSNEFYLILEWRQSMQIHV